MGGFGKGIFFFQGVLKIQNESLRSHGNRTQLPAGFFFYLVSSLSFLFAGRSRSSRSARGQRNPGRKRGEGDDLGIPSGINGFILFLYPFCGHWGNAEGGGIQEATSTCRNPGKGIREGLKMRMEISWICSGFSCSLNLGKLPWQDPVALCWFVFFPGKSRVWNSWPAWAEGGHRWQGEWDHGAGVEWEGVLGTNQEL